MPRVHKTIQEAKAHLGQSTAVIPERYATATGKASWEEPTSSTQAQANYEAGLAEANAEGRRQAGVARAGDAKYRKGCAEKGKGVIAQRINQALGDYEREFSPVLSAMNSASDAAPPRTRDFRANITNRLVPVVEAAKGAAKR